jgi:hypothetical protein
VASVLDNGDDVCAFCCHADQVTTRAVGEFNGVNSSSRADNVCNVRDTGTRSYNTSVTERQV